MVFWSINLSLNCKLHLCCAKCHCLKLQWFNLGFNSILLFYLDITYNNLILIDNVVQTTDDETNNILCTTRHTGYTWQEFWTSVKWSTRYWGAKLFWHLYIKQAEWKSTHSLTVIQLSSVSISLIWVLYL